MTERTMQDDAVLAGTANARDAVHDKAPGRRTTRVDRRRYSFETLRRSVVEPRRFGARRREDRRFPMLDRFDAGMLAMAIALLGFSILDSLFTLILLSRGGSELNPFMNWVLGYGVWAFTAVKMTLTAVPAVLLVATGNLRLFGMRARSMLAVLVGLYAGLIVYELMLLSAG